jgi:hypothetical protein
MLNGKTMVERSPWYSKYKTNGYKAPRHQKQDRGFKSKDK